jgi:Domain of unknown function DUF1828
MKLQEICRALCAGLAMREVPIGYAIRTPFQKLDGDAIGVYLRREIGSPGLLRLEDDGGTIASLEEDGVSFASETRSDALNVLLHQYNAQFDENTMIIHTDYLPESRIPANFAKFMALLIRLQDLRLLSQDRVRELFKDDVRLMLSKHFGGQIEILEDEKPNHLLPDYVADFVLRSPSGETLALFAASSETKALEALLLWQELARRRLTNVHSMAIFEGAKPQKIKSRTMSRLMNSEVLLGTLEGDPWELARKMAQNLDIKLNNSIN